MWPGAAASNFQNEASKVGQQSSILQTPVCPQTRQESGERASGVSPPAPPVLSLCNGQTWRLQHGEGRGEKNMEHLKISYVDLHLVLKEINKAGRYWKKYVEYNDLD